MDSSLLSIAWRADSANTERVFHIQSISVFWCTFNCRYRPIFLAWRNGQIDSYSSAFCSAVLGGEAIERAGRVRWLYFGADDLCNITSFDEKLSKALSG